MQTNNIADLKVLGLPADATVLQVEQRYQQLVAAFTFSTSALPELEKLSSTTRAELHEAYSRILATQDISPPSSPGDEKPAHLEGSKDKFKPIDALKVILVLIVSSIPSIILVNCHFIDQFPNGSPFQFPALFFGVLFLPVVIGTGIGVLATHRQIFPAYLISAVSFNVIGALTLSAWCGTSQVICDKLIPRDPWWLNLLLAIPGVLIIVGVFVAILFGSIGISIWIFSMLVRKNR